jgi:dTDP-4-dehydrorhamnose reductase
MKKIIILGPNGMLGQMVLRYFSVKGYEVIPLTKRYSYELREDFMKEIKSQQQGIVVNCIGKIKQKETTNSQLYELNSVLPLDLISTLGDSFKLIQPSTDCVFDGLKGDLYTKDDLPNASDSYGWSKFLGENAISNKENCIIIRVSIIGPDKNNNPKGLLGWFLSHPSGSNINGYTNHYWNGITTLEWCKQVENLISDNINFDGRIIQLESPGKFSKYDLLNITNQIFNTQYKINKFETTISIDRRLKGDIVVTPIETQLSELLRFNF